MSTKIHIGTSGWSYKHWRSIYYPQKLRSADWLNYYSKDFNTTEINGSFYRLPKTEHIENWMKQVPKDFVFCPKMSRFLTHMKKLKDPEDPLERFFSVFEPMQKQMGPVLLQLPPMLKFHYDTADHFYSVLKKRYKKYSFVIEVRHETWLCEESLTLMTKYEIGFVMSHSKEEFPYAEHITAKNIYIRLHGPDALYASGYDDKLLWEYVFKLRDWVNEGHEIWIFFNNDIYGYAVENAKRLLSMVGL